MIADHPQDTPRAGGPCRNEYVRPGGRQRGDRIVRCHLPAGHPGEHEEADTEITWTDGTNVADPTPDPAEVEETHTDALFEDLYRDWPGEPGLDLPPGDVMTDPRAVELAARVLYETEWRDSAEPKWDDLPAGDQESYRRVQRAVLAALAAEGRLPAEIEWALRFNDGSVSTGLWTTEKSARQRAQEYGHEWAEPVRRQVGPWLPVPEITETKES